MTAPTPVPASVPNGRRAPRPRTGLVGLVQRMAAALGIAVLVASSALASGAAPAAAATTPTPSPTAADPQLVAAPLAGGIVSPGDSLAVSIGLDAGTSPLTAAAATVSVGTDPLSTRAEIDDWLRSPSGQRAPTVVGTASLDGAAPGERVNAIVRVAADDPVLSDRVPGVYPVLATVTSTGLTLRSASVFVVPAAATTDVAVIVPLTAPATGRGLLSADQLAGLTAEDGSLTAALTGVQGTDAILGIDPAIPAAIRVLGSAAPASARDWLARLEALPNPRFALQFGDADPAAQVAAGIQPLAPTSLAAYIDPAGFTGDDPDPPSPTPTTTATPAASEADADESGLPTLDHLLDVGATAAIWWPEAVTPEIVAALGANGALTLTTTDAVRVPAPARGVSGGAGLLIADAELSAALSAAASASDSVLRAAAIAEASALEQLPVTGGTTIVALARDPDRTAVALRAAIDAAQSFPGARPLTLGTLVGLAPGEVAVGDQPLPTTRVDAIPALLEGERRIDAFASVIAAPALLTGVEHAEILQLLSLGWTGQDAQWRDALTDHADRTQATLSSVAILPPSPIQLVAADAEIPVGIRNDLPYPVTVTLHAHSNDLRLEVAENTVVAIGPEQSTRASLPVKARVGSGTVDVELWLTSPTGVRIGSDEQLEVNVRADWETIGLIVLSVLAAAFLSIGVIRTVRRIRRRPDADAPAAQEEQS